MHERIRATLADVFACPVADIPEDASTETVADWDSLHHLELMLALEMEFGVTVDTAALAELTSVDAIAEYLGEQGVTTAA